MNKRDALDMNIRAGTVAYLKVYAQQEQLREAAAAIDADLHPEESAVAYAELCAYAYGLLSLRLRIEELEHSLRILTDEEGQEETIDSQPESMTLDDLFKSMGGN